MNAILENAIHHFAASPVRLMSQTDSKSSGNITPCSALDPLQAGEQLYPDPAAGVELLYVLLCSTPVPLQSRTRNWK